jgi:hypothetical protein
MKKAVTQKELCNITILLIMKSIKKEHQTAKKIHRVFCILYILYCI